MAPPKTINAPRGTIKGASLQNLVTFSIRSAPVPDVILQFLLHNLTTLRTLQQDRQTDRDSSIDIAPESELAGAEGNVLYTPSVRADQFWNALEEKCKEAGGEWVDICDRIWSFGPRHAGGCVLVDCRKDTTPLSCVTLRCHLGVVNVSFRLKRRLSRNTSAQTTIDATESDVDFTGYVETGFQLATFQGPLCAEPVEGMAYFLESIDIDTDGIQKEIGRVSHVFDCNIY
jgi:ribosome assembly protein 1